MSRMAGAWATLLIVCGAAHADKKIAFKFEHAPILAAVLNGRVVTPGSETGDCAREFGALLFQDMRARGVAMVGDASSAGAPKIILSVEVSRCEARPQPAILGEGLPAVHISRTEGWFQAQIRAVTESDGHELAAVPVHGHAQKENQSQTSSPEWPAPAEVKAMAIRQGFADAQRVYLPWTENREIPFMDSKDCHLKQAFDVAKSGDYQELLRVSRANAGGCTAGAKAAVEAWYNLGVAALVTRHYDDAIAAFQKACDLNGAKLVAGLLDESKRESAAARAREAKAAPAAPAAPVQTGIMMTNDFVIKLIDGNVAEEEVLRMIANQPGHFSLEPGDVARLKAARVSDAVIAAMRKKSAPDQK